MAARLVQATGPWPLFTQTAPYLISFWSHSGWSLQKRRRIPEGHHPVGQCNALHSSPVNIHRMRINDNIHTHTHTPHTHKQEVRATNISNRIQQPQTQTIYCGKGCHRWLFHDQIFELRPNLFFFCWRRVVADVERLADLLGVLSFQQTGNFCASEVK